MWGFRKLGKIIFCSNKFIFIFLVLSFFPINGASQVLNFSPGAMAWADSIYALLTIEEKVSQLFIAGISDENEILRLNKTEFQPGFIMGSPNLVNRKWPKNNSFISPVIIPDLRYGFDSGIPEFPFPDENTILFMDKINREKLFIYMDDWLKNKRFQAFFAGGNYIFSEFVTSKPDYSAIIPNRGNINTGLNAWLLNVYKMPESIIGNLPSVSKSFFTLNGKNKLIANDDKVKKNTNDYSGFDQLLIKGSVFLTQNFEYDYKRVLFAIKERAIMANNIEKSCKNALAFKFELLKKNSTTHKQNHTNTLLKDLRLGYESSVGIFQHRNDFPLPLIFLDKNIGFISLGEGYFDEFKSMVANYVNINNSQLGPSDYNIVFLLLGPDYKFEQPVNTFFSEIKDRFPNASVIMVRAGDISGLPFDKMPSNLDALIVNPKNSAFTWMAMAQAIFNGIEVNKKNFFNGVPGQLENNSINSPRTRLKYGIPQEVGLNADTLLLINSVVDEAIKKTAIPGAQVFVAKNGVVVFKRNYGWLSNDKSQIVNDNTVYDLASITKVAATMPVIMQQFDNKRWQLNDKLSDYIPQVKSSEIENITIRQLLLHESGLPAFIPFYTEVIDRAKLVGNLFSNKRSSTHPIKMDNRLYMNKTVVYRDDVFQNHYDLNFSVPVANNIYMNVLYLDSMLNRIIKSKVDKAPKYRYSDLNFLLLQRISENLSQKSLDQLCNRMFYKYLGASSLCFNPLKIFSPDNIAPTENDISFRHQLIHGFVHDPAAAMMGGVAGHAGLFGTANDLAKVMQMFINKGVYGGYRYLDEETVDLFTNQQSTTNRRGLGFDKPSKEAGKTASVSQFASPLSYGHTGFTGTIAWADPALDLVYIFLSNRIHPNSYNKKLMELGVRPNIQSIIYRSVIQIDTEIK